MKAGDGQLTWLGSRGYFLMTCNAVSFLGVMIVFLPPMTLIGIGLLLIHKCSMTLGFAERAVFSSYRRAIQGLMSSLFFTYFPFLATPPAIEPEVNQGKGTYPGPSPQPMIVLSSLSKGEQIPS